MADDTDIREGHDRIAKRLFAHAGVVADLLRNCLPEGLLPTFDASTMRRFPEERVDSRLALRRADIAWEFELAEGPRMVLLIEAQSMPDAAMPARMMVQCGMVWEDCLRRGNRCPAILPVVFYTGAKAWHAADDLSQVVDCPSGLLALTARKCYLLLDAARLASSQLPEQGRMSLIVRMASAPTEGETKDALKQAWRRWVDEDEALCQDLAVWVRDVLWPEKFKGSDPEEVTMSVFDIFPEAQERFRTEGRQQGIEQGIEQATHELRAEERAWLGRQAVRKFGRGAGESLQAYLSDMHESADFERVLDWIVDCQSEAEILARLPSNRKAEVRASV